jgi:nicotinamidase-related amidase
LHHLPLRVEEGSDYPMKALLIIDIQNDYFPGGADEQVFVRERIIVMLYGS